MSLIGTGRTLRHRIESGDVAGDPNAWVPGAQLASETPAGAVAVWPLRKDGSLGVWQAIPETLAGLQAGGLVKAVLRPDGWALSYVPTGVRAKIDLGEVEVVGADPVTGSVRLEMKRDLTRAKTVWKRARHDAGWHGAVILRKLLNERVFDFPKSLYAVRDALEPVIGKNPDALVLDFFAGSGTTMHAVALLNHRDGGQRRTISVTNNEVSAAEALALREEGRLPGSPEWAARGIFNSVIRPRITAAIEGLRPDGQPIDLEYDDETFASQGLRENAEFFTLTYEDPTLVSLGRRFEAIAPLLWLRAGARGERISEVAAEGWSIPADACYGVLFDTSMWGAFVAAATRRDDLTHAFIVTDSLVEYQQVVARLDPSLPTTRLYADYLRSFEINSRS